ncbi:MAG TPA: hypothetical protein VFW80_04305 [Gaiellaceae bacterium]|nr:hypothetical protein [Gaiellaceae bacterium]
MDTPAALTDLPRHLQQAARVDPNGEVAWPLEDVADAITALADAGSVVLGLDTRTYYEAGGIMEVPRAEISQHPLTPEQERDEALSALDRYSGDYGDWVLVTWKKA